ncbi:MAG: thiamine biosynthesis protein [bacterium]|nr:thiamine biosynthesis protein [bacterium]
MIVTALGLLSGGLDSTLAAKLMLDQGIRVQGLNFNTGFCISDTRRQLKRRGRKEGTLRNEALRAGSDLNIPIEIVDVSEEYLSIVTNPRWGYGKNANPCLDCRIMMLRKAKALMPKFEAQFVFTGEVLGQRPMTQKRFTLRQIEKQTDLDGYLLRPLSALRLPETEAEKSGLVDRQRLLGIAGRSRKPQFELAKRLGIDEFPQPAGGCCFLTDPNYSRKFFDFNKYKAPDRQINLEDFTLLKVGRHLRLSDHLKLIVGRDEAENNFLERYTLGRWAFSPVDIPGPTALLEGSSSEQDRALAARIVARYSDHEGRSPIRIQCQKDQEIIAIDAVPIESDLTAQLLIN